MISTYTMFRMIKRFQADDYRELFREFGIDTLIRFIQLSNASVKVQKQ